MLFFLNNALYSSASPNYYPPIGEGDAAISTNYYGLPPSQLQLCYSLSSMLTIMITDGDYTLDILGAHEVLDVAMRVQIDSQIMGSSLFTAYGNHHKRWQVYTQ